MPKESTLSTAAAAHNNECLAPVNVKRNVIENRTFSEFSDEVVDFDDGGTQNNDE